MTSMHTFQSEVKPLVSVVLKTSQQAFVSQEHLSENWQSHYYTSEPDFIKACSEYDAFKQILIDSGVECIELPATDKTTMDSIYVRDAAISTDKGMILCNMGKAQRMNEPAAQEAFYRSHDIPILGSITGEGQVEGGDVAWLNDKTLAVAWGYRTNWQGIEQLRDLLDDDIELVIAPSPHWNGPTDVYHLMSSLSPVAEDKLLVFSRLLTVPFRDFLLESGFDLIEIAEHEYDDMACNVLALAPNKVLMLEGLPDTRKALESNGVEVLTYAGNEISLKGCGGPTCLTRPLARALS